MTDQLYTNPQDIKTIYANWHVARLQVNLFNELHGNTPLTKADRDDIKAMQSEEFRWELWLRDAGYMVTVEGDVYLREGEV